MSMSCHEIRIEYDNPERNCYVILDSGKAIGLGTTDREALEDLRDVAHFYIDTTIDLKLQEVNGTIPVEGREDNGSD